MLEFVVWKVEIVWKKLLVFIIQQKNMYLSNFTKNGIEFSSMEQYMMYGKAMCFHDETIAKQILQTDDVTRIKELGRLVSNYNDQIWSGMRQIIVYEGLVEKFSQNQELSDALLNTGDAFLAECAVKDKVWGIGLSSVWNRHYGEDRTCLALH